MRKGSAIFLAAAVLLPAVVQANYIVNGDFETAPKTVPFPSWSQSVNGEEAVAPSALDGTTSLETLGSFAGDVSQNFPSTGTSPFSLSFDFAATDPGSVTAGANRSVNVLLLGSNNGQINFRVVDGSTSGDGTAQIYDGGAWRAVSADSAISFSSNLSSPTKQTLSIQGTPGGNYTVTVNGSTLGPFSYYQNAVPGNFTSVNLETLNNVSGGANGNTVYDNIVFTPEPASLSLLVAGAGMLLLRRKTTRA